MQIFVLNGKLFNWCQNCFGIDGLKSIYHYWLLVRSAKNILHFKSDDLVFIDDNPNVEKAKRFLGWVMDVFRSKDNFMRTVKIKTSELLRLVPKLCLLDESE